MQRSPDPNEILRTDVDLPPPANW